MTDPIADMLTRIRNAQLVSQKEVRIPFSRLKYEIAKILEENNFVEKINKVGRGPRKVIKISLKYIDGRPAISGLKRISKPGRRVYVPVKKIKRVKEGYGIAIISTPKGLMTDKEARRNKVGGEIICEIW
ncbi:30S ribosomal protein S8 [bacterium]|nr:30S ribosomal protein S8 [bacterium]